jgi:glycosyltransferase involved in cell wall biosynthesis
MVARDETPLSEGHRDDATRPGVVLLSEYFPFRPDHVVGSFQRMELFIDAIRPFAPLDMLFFVPARACPSAQQARAHHERLRAKWQGAPRRLHFCPKWDGGTGIRRAPAWARQARCLSAGAVSYYPERISFGTSGLRQVAAVRDCLRTRPRAVFAHTLGAMAPLNLIGSNLPPVFFDLNDVENRKLDQEILLGTGSGLDLRRRATRRVLDRAVRRAARLATQTYVCADDDRDYLRRRSPRSEVITVPNAVRLPEPLPATAEPVLLFLGSYWYRPNVDAARYLIQEILPRVRNKVPGARLIIAGPGPERIPEHGAEIEGVEIRGFVEDLRGLYQSARVFCCPIQRGAGTRIKIIEAAAYGRPVVATSFGASGLDFVDERQLLLREDADSFAAACVRLLQDDALCARLGASARATAIRLYDRRSVSNEVRNLMLAALRSDPAPAKVAVHG